MQRNQIQSRSRPETVQRTPSRRQAQSASRTDSDDEVLYGQRPGNTPSRPNRSVRQDPTPTGAAVVNRVLSTSKAPAPSANGSRRTMPLTTPVTASANVSSRSRRMQQQNNLYPSANLEDDFESGDFDDVGENIAPTATGISPSPEGHVHHVHGGRPLQRMASGASYGSHAESVSNEADLRFGPDAHDDAGSMMVLSDTYERALSDTGGVGGSAGGQHAGPAGGSTGSGLQAGSGGHAAGVTSRTTGSRVGSGYDIGAPDRGEEEDAYYDEAEAYLGFGGPAGARMAGSPSPRPSRRAGIGGGERSGTQATAGQGHGRSPAASKAGGGGAFTHSPCGASVVYGVPSEQVNPGGSATVAPTPPQAKVAQQTPLSAKQSSRAMGGTVGGTPAPPSATPGAGSSSRVITARPRELNGAVQEKAAVQAAGQRGQSSARQPASSSSYPSAGVSTPSRRQASATVQQQQQALDAGDAGEAGASDDEREVLYGHIAGLRPRAAAAPPAPPGTQAGAALRSAPSMRSAATQGTAASKASAGRGQAQGGAGVLRGASAGKLPSAGPVPRGKASAPVAAPVPVSSSAASQGTGGSGWESEGGNTTDADTASIGTANQSVDARARAAVRERARLARFGAEVRRAPIEHSQAEGEQEGDREGDEGTVSTLSTAVTGSTGSTGGSDPRVVARAQGVSASAGKPRFSAVTEATHEDEEEEEDEEGGQRGTRRAGDTDGSSLDEGVYSSSRASKQPLLARQASQAGTVFSASAKSSRHGQGLGGLGSPAASTATGGAEQQGGFMSPGGRHRATASSIMSPAPSAATAAVVAATPLGDVTNTGGASQRGGLMSPTGGLSKAKSIRLQQQGALATPMQSGKLTGGTSEEAGAVQQGSSPDTAATAASTTEPASIGGASEAGADHDEEQHVAAQSTEADHAGADTAAQGDASATTPAASPPRRGPNTPDIPHPRPYFMRDGPRVRSPYKASNALNDYDFDVCIVVHVPVTDGPGKKGGRDGAKEARKLRKADAEAEARAWAAAHAQQAQGSRFGGAAGMAIGRDGLEVTIPLDITLSGPVNEWEGMVPNSVTYVGPGFGPLAGPLAGQSRNRTPGKGLAAKAGTGLSLDSSFTLSGANALAGGASAAGGLQRPEEDEEDLAGTARVLNNTGILQGDGERRDSASDTDSNSGSESDLDLEGEDDPQRGKGRTSLGGQVWNAVGRVAAAARKSIGGLGSKGRASGGRREARSASKGRRRSPMGGPTEGTAAAHRSRSAPHADGSFHTSSGDAVVTVLPRSPIGPHASSLGDALSPALAALGLSPPAAIRTPHYSRLAGGAGPSSRALGAAVTPGGHLFTANGVSNPAARPHKCQEILKALKRARLQATRLRSLSKSTWLIGIKAPEWRLELEAEKLRLRMRRKDGGWSKFKRRFKEAFVPAVPEEMEGEDAGDEEGEDRADAQGGEAGGPRAHAVQPEEPLSSGDEALAAAASKGASKSRSLMEGGQEGMEDPVHAAAVQGDAGAAVEHGRAGGKGGKRAKGTPTLFHSSDRQTLINHILRSSVMEGGADLGVGSPLGKYVTDMFPVHMYARLVELRSDWLAIWRPERSRGEYDRIGLLDPAWYKPPQLLDLPSAADAAGSGDVEAGDSPTAAQGASAGCCGGGKGAVGPHHRRHPTTTGGAAAPRVPADGGVPSCTTSSGAKKGPHSALDSVCMAVCCMGREGVKSTRLACAASPTVAFLCAAPPARLAYTLGVLACKAGRSWGRLWSNLMTQPLDRIAAYFGETIAFYFAWLEFYTHWLVAPSLVGVLLFLGQLYWGRIDIAYVPLFSLFMSLWSILFLEYWKRRNAELAQRWGVLHYEDEEAVRPQFTGTWKQDAATGEVVRVYPTWKRVMTYCVTVPITLLFVCGMVLILIAVYTTRDRLVAGFEAAGMVQQLHTLVAGNSTLAADVASGALPTLPAVPNIDIAGSMRDTWVGIGYGLWTQLGGSTEAFPGARGTGQKILPFGSTGFETLATQADAFISALQARGVPLSGAGWAISRVSQVGNSAPPSGSAGSMPGDMASDSKSFSFDFSDVTGGIDLGRFRAYFDARGDWRWWVAMTVPPVALGLLMPLIDYLFSKLALVFNDWENHATESMYRNHRIAKVFFFRFTVSFISLFYYAFSPQHSLVQLSVQLATFSIVSQTWNNILEGSIPGLKRAWKECRFRRRLAHAEESGLTEGRHGRKLVRHATALAWSEYRMPVYDSFGDYAELLIQFGYVSFFSWAFPLAPACALINNIMEMRSDAYKLCYNMRRPIAHKAGGIGVWYNVLVWMSLFALLTNCAHLALASKSFDAFFPSMTQSQRMLMVFIVEHCVLALKMLLPYIVPSVPAHVKWRMARDAHATAKLHGRRPSLNPASVVHNAA